MEIEAKFRITAPIQEAAIESVDLSPYRLVRRGDHALRDQVLDTATRALTGQGFALRLRRDGTRLLVTLKQSAGAVDGAVHTREEWEVEADPAAIARNEWPAVIQEHLGSILSEESLQTLVSVSNQRRVWDVQRDGLPIAELALDEGIIQAGGREQPFRELEIELKGGGPGDLSDLSARLAAHLPLTPEPESKFGRGLALLGSAAPATPADQTPRRPQTAKTARSTQSKETAAEALAAGAPEASATSDSQHGSQPPATESLVETATPTPPSYRPLLETGKEQILLNLRRLHEATPIARDGVDPEGVHQMRVASRRLRAAFQVLEDTGADPVTTRRMRTRLRALANSLGETRDADVMLEALDAYLKDLSSEVAPGLEPIRQSILTRRTRARKKMLQQLDRGATHKLLSSIQKWAERGAAKAKRPGDVPQPVLVRHFAPSAIWRRYEEILAFETVMPAPIPTLHQLRISGKRLRYTLEFFAGAMRGEARDIRSQLTNLQDLLGGIQDADFALALIDDLAKRKRGTAALQDYRNHRRDAQAELVLKVPAAWDALTGAGFRNRLAELLAAM